LQHILQVTGDHGFFSALILADLDRIRQIARGGEPKLKFQLAPSGRMVTLDVQRKR
jgi:hypothetical protein